MTHQYKSELIKEIMEARGHEKSSLHYESECIESWIEENKGAYPKLCDYQSEWLNYINKNIVIGDFPYVTLTDVTDATINNVVPLAYQSAILMGNTLVNYFPEYTKTMAIGTGNWRTIFNGKINIPLTPNTSYLFINNSNVGKKIHVSVIGETTAENNVLANLTTNIAKFTTPNTTDNFSRMKVYLMEDNTSELTYDSFMVIPYQDGMENWDIPFFTGMQTVKMPVLTATGKNLFDINHFSKLENWDGKVTTERPYYAYEMKLKPNTSYTFSRKENSTGSDIYFCISKYKGVYDWNGGIVHPTDTSVNRKQITTDSTGILYFNLYQAPNELANLISLLEEAQLEEGSVATPYEPYKSNILTVNEDVELRGIGDVQDTLDLILGEIIESIGEGVLNGSEEWICNPPKEQPNHWCFHNDQKLAGEKLLISDRFPQSDIDGDRESIRGGGDFIFVYISKEKVDGNNNSFKQWLSQNPIKYQYRKSEKSVKTVDLLVQDQNGNIINKIKPIEGTMHLSTSSDTINPLFSGEIPVEATTQNLASFINLEMEE